ncbi:peptidylprolyl isomerase [Elizabethkingia sp. JS20170427COW]|uniref:peptidylprolyl isomerase n=1 Tax=Elizabethkingia sp. JS20170427COW TaxID=2583851 RepID=UPI0011108ABD|nr:peptidylprolyl isomerase [Elizabethkingia sp. JS20170427COW]QCX53219.1 peptidylprolyl isomerase [Elizabethkingia sp. JS20170427COW]
MAVLGEIRKRPWILIGFLAIALLAFLVNPDSLDKVFGKDPNILGKVNGENITREELEDQIFLLQQQSQGQPREALEEQAWQMLIQSKLIAQQFDKMGMELTDDMFWNQIQYDPMFAQNPQLFDEKGNFKVQELKKEIEALKAQSPENYANWLKMKKGIEYRIMARQLFANVSSAITINNIEAKEIIKQRDQLALIDYIKIDYQAYAAKHKVAVTTQDLADFIKKHPVSFKTDASRNIGVVLFPAKPSAADKAVAKNEINKLYTQGVDMGSGIESFQNTKNDSMFVTVNSDVPFNPAYLPLAQQQVEELKTLLPSASIGQSFGPFKVQDRYFVVSKLLDKKTSDSIKSRHILITYKGNMADQTGKETRTKEEAKQLADKIGTEVKANPAKFAEYLKLSADLGSASQGGELGWTTDETPFVPEFKAYLSSHPKGSTGVVETQYGYHIINIEDKKPGAMAYKVANLVKEIKASDKTNNAVYTEANKFIQEVQGKSFNDFANIAKKKHYQFENPKLAKRFQGSIQGINSDKDSEVLAWAFDKKTKVGETNIFTTSNGDYVVAYLAGAQEAGLADPESVRDQIEPIVKNQLIAKKIIAELNAKKAGSLDQIAKAFASQKQSAEVGMLSPIVGGAMEAKVAGVAFGVKANQLSLPIEGRTGVYVILKKSIKENKQPGDEKSVVSALQQQSSQMFGQSLLKSLQDKADIKDYRIEIYGKAVNN